VISFPAIAEQDESHAIETPLGAVRFDRHTDELLHPAREPRATIDLIRSTLGEYNFAGQYQQAPAPLGGGLGKEAWFRRYDNAELTDPFEQIVQSWDTANKPTELSDYSVCTTWDVSDKRFYLLSVPRKRMDYPSLKRAVREQWQAFDAKMILIEDKASGTQLIQELFWKRYEIGLADIVRITSATALARLPH
jgi:phage terminase large subunit-like protein